MMLLTIVCLIVFVLGTLMFINWLERKTVGRFQDRYGPNRVGPLGILQFVADAIKMLTKEDITPANADRVIFNLAPVMVVVPTFLVLAVLPFGRGMVAADLNIGFLYIVAVSSLTTIAILLAGWGSRNKYSLLGGMRVVAQMISYEVPMVLSALGAIMLTGSLSLVSIVEGQSRVPFILLQPLGFLIYFISAVAEVNRAPFDLPEAESEIIAGYHTEYSGMKYAMFLLAEYINAFIVSAIATTLFLGGWKGPLLPPYIWFFLKAYAIYFVLMWLRFTLPRLRIDQLMALAWKFLVPLALVNLLAMGLVLTLTQGKGLLPLVLASLVANGLIVAAVVIIYGFANWRRRAIEVAA
ncbi:MAG: NADH-quinone oxidoreductase subunit NuoH [Anaerolineae bacterium]|nr:NADH-quinone oxidoreductase subunit NuoH [Anaerolineae bacterium]